MVVQRWASGNWSTSSTSASGSPHPPECQGTRSGELSFGPEKIELFYFSTWYIPGNSKGLISKNTFMQEAWLPKDVACYK